MVDGELHVISSGFSMVLVSHGFNIRYISVITIKLFSSIERPSSNSCLFISFNFTICLALNFSPLDFFS